MNKDYFLPASVLLAGVLIAGAVLYTNGVGGVGGQANLGEAALNDSNSGADAAVSLELNSSDVILGDPNAPVTVIEYGDFQCPFCGRFYSQTEKLIKENYVKSGQVRFVYRHFAFLGPESKEAAEAAECAKDQGKFWEFHDALYDAEIKDGAEHNGNLNVSLFNSLANRLGLNAANFSACVKAKKYADKVQSDYDNGIVAGVQATPTAFVNGQKLEGAVPFSNFQKIIEQFLNNR